MKIPYLLALSGCTILCLAACSSKPERPDPPEGYFATHIDADNIKKFQYTIDFPDRGNSRGGGSRPGNTAGHVSGSSSRGVSGGITAGTANRGRGGASGISSYEQFQQVNKRLENAMVLELNKSGFCHEGHRETERVVEPPMVYIRGECTETATAEDRARFPNDAD